MYVFVCNQQYLQIGTKLVYPPSPEPVMYVVQLSHIMGKLPLVLHGGHMLYERAEYCQYSGTSGFI
jgi:hypothetical protein